jgi:hypothetical protein
MTTLYLGTPTPATRVRSPPWLGRCGRRPEIAVPLAQPLHRRSVGQPREPERPDAVGGSRQRAVPPFRRPFRARPPARLAARAPTPRAEHEELAWDTCDLPGHADKPLIAAERRVWYRGMRSRCTTTRRQRSCRRGATPDPRQLPRLAGRRPRGRAAEGVARAVGDRRAGASAGLWPPGFPGRPLPPPSHHRYHTTPTRRRSRQRPESHGEPGRRRSSCATAAWQRAPLSSNTSTLTQRSSIANRRRGSEFTAK